MDNSLHNKTTKEELIGSTVRCTTTHLKYVEKDAIYIIGSVTGSPSSWSNTFYVRSIRLKGIKGSYSVDNFIEVPAAVMRDMQIESIFDDSEEKIVSTKNKTGKRLDNFLNKEEELFKLIIKRIKGSKSYSWNLKPFDEIVKLIVKRNVLDATTEDFEQLRHLTLEQILGFSQSGDDGSVGEELLQNVSDLEERCYAVFKSSTEEYFSLEEALELYGVSLAEYESFLSQFCY